MFTGIIADLGTITLAKEDPRGGMVFTIRAPAICKGLKLGDSVAVNGACHTVVKKTAQAFTVESMPETLARTNLGTLAVGSRVNLERPMRVGGSLDGHIVTGHIDTVVKLAKITPAGNSYVLTFATPKKWMGLIVEKGSVALDGISLTVASVAATSFTVAIIPHTWAVTNLGTRAVGEMVNLEADILAKHVAKLLNR